jgi:hypothetical protein
LRLLGCGCADLLIGLVSVPPGLLGLFLGALGLTGADIEEQTISGRSEFLSVSLGLLLFGSNTSYLSPLPGHGGKVLYCPDVFLFIPGLLGVQESLLSFA